MKKLKTWAVGALGILMVPELMVSEALAGHGRDFDSVTPAVAVTLKPRDFIGAMEWLQSHDYDISGIDHQAGTIEVIMFENPGPAHPMTRAFPVIKSEVVRAPDQRYHTPEKVEAALKDFENRYPDLVAVQSLGQSDEGRDIWAIRITDERVTAPKKAVLFDGMHHAREVMSTEVPMDTVEFLLTNFEKDPKVTGWVKGLEIWIVPMLNVDGNAKVWAQEPMWRKNTRNEFGVDINRNYPYNWNACQGSSGMFFSDAFRGEAPGSESETQALIGLAKKIRPIFNVSYHSFGELVLFPYGCRGTTPSPRIAELGRKLASLLPKEKGGTYTAGSPWDILYPVDGDSITYMAEVLKVESWVIEIGTAFQPAYSFREPTVQKLRAAWGLLLDEALKSPATN